MRIKLIENIIKIKSVNKFKKECFPRNDTWRIKLKTWQKSFMEKKINVSLEKKNVKIFKNYIREKKIILQS